MVTRLLHVYRTMRSGGLFEPLDAVDAVIADMGAVFESRWNAYRIRRMQPFVVELDAAASHREPFRLGVRMHVEMCPGTCRPRLRIDPEIL